MPGYLEAAQAEKEKFADKIRDKAEKMKDLLRDVGAAKAGKFFGELALEFDPMRPDRIVKRKATITATEDCMFAIMTKKDY